ncbi:angiopoietin-related protein 7-like [Physella acuta]|uniref:angiopoietin-related protein 7-like n=1 Tax=Physella acuta TaxID=109671 RepID=UPI0027DB1F58|nr:angiopoietin-related protein 7-like [Physella acuta]
MIAVLFLVTTAVIINTCTGLSINMKREYVHHGKDLFCAQLQCTENIREDTQISALVNMSVYRISEPEGKILVTSISESDSKIQDYTKVGTRGNITRTFAEMVVLFSKKSDCIEGIFTCEIHYLNTNESVAKIEKKTDRFQRKSSESLIMMNLKAKTSDYVKSVDTMADFLKSFEDPDRLKGADMTLSLQMSHSGGDKFSTDKSVDAVLTDDFNIIPFSTFEDLLHYKIKNLTLDVNKTLQMMENKVNLATELNKNSLSVLNESIQTKLANAQNQTEQLSIRLNEMETNIKKTITQENINTTLNLVAGLNKTLQGFIDEYNGNPLQLLYVKQCVRNDIASLLDKKIIKLNDQKLALCDTKTDGGGWIVIQRRVVGDVNFTRNWSEYKNGFGSLDGDFWMGNDLISNLTQNGYSELRFDMKFKGKSYYMVYSNVTVGNETDLYRIKFIYKTGNTIEQFSWHNGMAFSTFDKDNDESSRNCAENYKGGWWFNNCRLVHANGVWQSQVSSEGVAWFGLTLNDNYLDSVEIKIRRL